MIYTVTMNPAVDYIVYVDELKVGKTNRANREEVFLGGKGINVSIVLTHLGVATKALGFAAGATGELLERGLQQRGIPADLIHLPRGNTRINVKIRGKVESEVNGSGPEVPGFYVAKLMRQLKDCLEEGDMLVLAGSVPPAVPQTIYGEIMADCAHRSVKVAVDAAGALMEHALPHKPFLIKPNRAELGELFGTEVERPEEVLRCAEVLQKRGARNVLVSLGGDGSLLLDETGKLHQMGVPKGILNSSVGAGDSMVAGFLAGYEKSGDYEVALRVGAACGSATAYSSALATLEDVKRLYRELQK